MITHRSAALLNHRDYGVEVGNPADLVIIDAATDAEAIATVAPVLAAFKRGRQTLERPRARLLRAAEQ
jgi:cytosine/creatinine deaminase